MRPKMKFTWNEISFRYEKNSVYINFHCRKIKINFFIENFFNHSENKHLRMRIFHKNGDCRSKDNASRLV